MKKARVALNKDRRASIISPGVSLAPAPEQTINSVSNPYGRKNTNDLLGDLLYAFGWEPEKLNAEPATPRMFGEVPTDPEIRAAESRRELAEVDPLLRELVKRAESLRAWPLRKPADYDREWRSIIETWNQAIRDRGWLDMTPLCEVCGKPLQRRATWRSREAPDKPQISFSCSELCRGAKRQRAHRLRDKLAGT